MGMEVLEKWIRRVNIKWSKTGHGRVLHTARQRMQRRKRIWPCLPDTAVWSLQRRKGAWPCTRHGRAKNPEKESSSAVFQTLPCGEIRAKA